MRGRAFARSPVSNSSGGSSHHVFQASPPLLLALVALFAAVRARRSRRRPTASRSAPEFVAATQQWLDDAVAKAQSASATPLRMEVSIGALDARLRLAPCTQVEPYIPVGLRLWGRTRLGLRCTDGGGRWNVFLPVTIKAFGPAWVLRDNVLAGAVLTAADALRGRGRLGRRAVAGGGRPGAVGRPASRPRSLAAGQPLRQSMVKAAQAFAAGSPVRVRGAGARASRSAPTPRPSRPA